MPETRERPTYRRRTTRARRGAPPTNVSRIAIGALVVIVAIVVTVAGLGAASPDREFVPDDVRPASAEPTSTESPEPVAHITFGAHETADMPCDSCHSVSSEHKPFCRACHDNMCGKGVTTVAGCLKCHETGTTDDWDPDGRAPR